MKKISYLLIMFSFMFLVSCNTDKSVDSSINPEINESIGETITLSSSEVEDLLNLGKSSLYIYHEEEIIDLLIEQPDVHSLFLSEIGDAKYILCLYVNEYYASSLYRYNPILLESTENCEWVKFDNIDSIVDSRNGKKLAKVFIVHKMTILKDLITNEVINKDTVYYEDYTRMYFYNEPTNFRAGYYMLFERKNWIFNKTYTDIEIMCRTMYNVIQDDSNLYVILTKIVRDYDGTEHNYLKSSTGKYYDDIEPYIIDDYDFSKETGAAPSNSDMCRLDISVIRNIILEEQNENQY